MIVAFASGKGGTGKTTLTLSLADSLAQDILVLDCDVEEPNGHLFLVGEPEETQVVEIPVPEVDESLCDACGKCARACAYNAIVSLKTKPLVFPELCHGCGGCMLACPRNAIREVGHRTGEVEGRTHGSIRLIQGKLDVGAGMATPVIRAVTARAAGNELVLIDAPPGTSCPMVTSVRKADVVVLVTEPTPFGLNDLKLAVATLRQLRLPVGVVVNRDGSGDKRVHEWCERERIPVLASIPEARRVAEASAKGQLPARVLPEYAEWMRALWGQILSLKEGVDVR